MTIRTVGLGSGLMLACVLFFASAARTQAKQSARPAQKDQSAHKDHGAHNEAMLACAKACSDCQRICDSCSTHCAKMVADGQKEHMATLMACQDCATVCAAAAQIVARGGPYSSQI